MSKSSFTDDNLHGSCLIHLYLITMLGEYYN